MRINQLAVDAAKEQEGVWQPIGDDAAIKVARSGSPRHRDVMRRLMAPHRQAVRAGVLPESTATEMLIEATVESILLDWRGLEDESGRPLPYSREKAREILRDPKYREFLDMVTRYSEDAQLFREDSIKEDAEHLKP